MTALKVIGAGVAAVVGVFALLWLLTAIGIVSPANVREQWRFAYDYDASLKAIARQVCTAEKAVTDATTDTERTQRRTQLIAIANNYARVAAEYDARLRDAFRAGLVRPPDVPTQAPTLEANKARVCS